MSIAVKDISGTEYSLLLLQLDDLPYEEAYSLRSQLAEKYYAYLDKKMQLNMAAREFEDIAATLAASSEKHKMQV